MHMEIRIYAIKKVKSIDIDVLSGTCVFHLRHSALPLT